MQWVVKTMRPVNLSRSKTVGGMEGAVMCRISLDYRAWGSIALGDGWPGGPYTCTRVPGDGFCLSGIAVNQMKSTHNGAHSSLTRQNTGSLVVKSK